MSLRGLIIREDIICLQFPSEFELNHLRWWETVTIAVTEEKDTLAKSLGALGRLDPLASSSTRPHGLDETPGTALNIGAVVTT